MIDICTDRHSPHRGSYGWEPPADLRTAMSDLSQEQRATVGDLGYNIVEATLPLSNAITARFLHSRASGPDLLNGHLDPLMNAFIWACLELRDEQRASKLRPIETARHIRDEAARIRHESTGRVGLNGIAEVVGGLHNIARLLVPDGRKAIEVADRFVAMYVEQIIGLYSKYTPARSSSRY